MDDILARLAAKPASPPGGEPLRFALFNLQVRDGQAEFDDQSVGAVHRLDGLAISIPFLSNLVSRRQMWHRSPLRGANLWLAVASGFDNPHRSTRGWV